MNESSTRGKLIGVAALIIFSLMALGGPDLYAALGTPEPTERVAEGDDRYLKRVFPDADVFSVKTGAYPTHRAYKTDPETGIETLVGFVFLTTDIEPTERGYGGRIPVLVGMTTNGIVTGIRVSPHNEPWGLFSIDEPAYAEQFIGKSVLDPFEVGRDIDAVTRVTITVKAATRTIRKSARKIARQHLEETQ